MNDTNLSSTGFYNEIEIFSPVLELFFPELTEGKIFKAVITTELNSFDIPLLIQATNINEMFQEAFAEMADDVPVILTGYNNRYFSNDKPKESDAVLVGNALMFNPHPTYDRKDFVVSESLLCQGTNVITNISTITAREPLSLNNKITLH